MIKVEIKQNQIKVKGHAMYDDYGKDIVCASVSTLLISHINLIMNLDEKAIKYQSKNGEITINVLKHEKIIDTVILNMILHLKELEKKYKQNIKIYEEV